MRLFKVRGDFSAKSSAGKERAGIAVSVYHQHNELEYGEGLEVLFSTSLSPAMVVKSPEAQLWLLKDLKLTTYLLTRRRL